MSKPHADRLAELLADLRSGHSLSPAAPAPRALAQRMGELRTPGVGIAVIDDFDLAWAGGYGVLRQGEASNVSGDTLFQAASISKPVFALAVMRQVQDGRIDLDADVNRYLTSWRIPHNGEWQPHVTLRQLLSHTAGTTVQGFGGYPTSGPWPTLREILAGLPPANNAAVVVDRLPGLQMQYSGGGTIVAQQVITDVLGRPFPELMRELVLDPLRMTRSTFEQPLPDRFVPDTAVGHAWNGVPINGGWHVYPEMAAAGLWTTARDLASLGVEVLRILRGDVSILGLDRVTASEMLRPQLPGQHIGEEFRGLGWRCSGRDDAFQFGHRGCNEGYVSSITLCPARGQGAVILLSSVQGAPLGDEILGAIGRQYDWALAEEDRTIASMPFDLDYAGEYRDHQGFTFAVSQRADGLLLHFNRQPPLPLAPISRLEFSASALHLRACFEAGDDGVIVAMTIAHGDQIIVATKR